MRVARAPRERAIVELERLGQKYVQTHEQDFVDTLEYGHAEEKAKEDAQAALSPELAQLRSVKRSRENGAKQEL